MELWIRSQSRQTLIKAEKIFTEDEEVYATTNSEFDERIGVYKTKERALEVLDEIQNCLSADFSFNGTYEQNDLMIKIKMINGLYGMIYTMPKE